MIARNGSVSLARARISADENTTFTLGADVELHQKNENHSTLETLQNTARKYTQAVSVHGLSYVLLGMFLITFIRLFSYIYNMGFKQ